MDNVTKEFYTGLLIWFVAIIIAYGMWFGDSQIIMYIPRTGMNVFLTMCCYFVFLLGYLISTGRLTIFGDSKAIQIAGLLLSGLASLVLSVCFFYGMISLLVTIIIAQLAFYLKQWIALMLAVLLPTLGLLLDLALDKSFDYPIIAYPTILIYGSFNFFSLLTHYHLIDETDAKEKSDQVLRELKATQSLLNATTKRNERLRIARDLHDSLGHQLTALSLQLEVAGHVSDDAKDAHLNEAKAISRALLFDVRETVSDIRRKNDDELAVALSSLTQGIPNLGVTLAIDVEESSVEACQVEVIFRCVQESITNIAKHSNATHCIINIFHERDFIVIKIKDNGSNISVIKPGNGLNGMSERIKDIGGSLIYSASINGFKLNVKLPSNL